MLLIYYCVGLHAVYPSRDRYATQASISPPSFSQGGHLSTEHQSVRGTGKQGGRGLCLSVSLFNILNIVAEYQPKPN